MNCLRGILAACFVCLALLCHSAAPSSLEAGPSQGHQRAYYVYYRASAYQSWSCYGGYYRINDAQTAVRWFQARRYQSFYR